MSYVVARAGNQCLVLTGTDACPVDENHRGWLYAREIDGHPKDFEFLVIYECMECQATFSLADIRGKLPEAKSA